MSDELLRLLRRLSSCRRMRSMKSNSLRYGGTDEARRGVAGEFRRVEVDESRRDEVGEWERAEVGELREEDLRRVDEESSLSSVNSSLIAHHSSLKSEVAAHRVEAGADRLYRGREGEAEAALAVLADDDAGHCGEGVERAVRRVADEAQFAEAGD